MTKRRDQNKKKLLAQLKKMPLVQIACQRVGVGRSTYYRWRKEDELFRGEVDEALAQGAEVVNDLAESKVISGINSGDQKYVFFWLNNRHPKYHLQRGPHTPSNLDLLEAELKRQIDKHRQMIKDFLDADDGGYDLEDKPKDP